MKTGLGVTHKIVGFCSAGILLFQPMLASAKCGGVDYAAIVAIIGALQIYFKMTTGEGDITKSIMMLVGACLFMIGAFILFPAFFGYNII